MLVIEEKPSTYTIEKLCDSPHLCYIRNFLSIEECQHLIDLAKAQLTPSSTVDPETGENILVEARSSFGTFLTHAQTTVVDDIEHRIAHLTNFPVENGEGIQILNYQIGQEYRPHFDYFDPNLKGSAVVLKPGGQRVLTVILYLNNVEAGGETVFPEAKQAVPPKMGDAVLFYNLLPNGETDKMSLHGGAPIIAGEKWIATKWVREQAFRS